MKNSKVGVMYETNYAKAYNLVLSKYYKNYDKYTPENLNKTRPIVIYHFGNLKSVAFKLTTTKQPRHSGMLFARENEFGTNKESYITFTPITVNNNELWKHGYYIFDETLKRKFYNALRNNSTKKKPYRMILEDAIEIVGHF